MMYNGFVYLAKSDTGHYKIGWAKNPYQRIKHFDTIMPVNVEIVHYFPCDNPREAESRMHRWAEFHGQRVTGEWFDLSEEAARHFGYIRFYLNGEFNQPTGIMPRDGEDTFIYSCCDEVVIQAVKENWAYYIDNDHYRIKGEWVDVAKEMREQYPGMHDG